MLNDDKADQPATRTPLPKNLFEKKVSSYYTKRLEIARSRVTTKDQLKEHLGIHPLVRKKRLELSPVHPYNQLALGSEQLTVADS